MQFTYTTDNLVLSTGDESYAPLVLDYLTRNREDFSKWERLYGDEFYTLAYQKRALQTEQKLFLASRGVRYYIFLKECPEFIIGNVSFSYLLEDDGHRCTLGYKIDPAFRRKGYAYEAISCLLPKVIKDFNIKRIEADILEENTASLNLIKKLGFEYEGVARHAHTIAGAERDHMRFSLIV